MDKKQCVWESEPDPETQGWWWTACDSYFVVEGDGVPKHQDYTHCPNCSGQIVIVEKEK